MCSAGQPNAVYALQEVNAVDVCEWVRAVAC